MKYIFITLFISVVAFSCKQDGEETEGGNKLVAPLAEICVPNDPVAKKTFDALAKDFWVVTGFHDSRDKKAARKNNGRWYKFSDDCTFTVGHFDKELSKGTWRLENSHIKLDALEVSEDAYWRVQMNSEGSMMVLVGTEEYQTNMIQQRVENIMFAPKNPKEMGWDW